MTCKTFYRVNPQTDERWKSYLCDTVDELPTGSCCQGEWAVVKSPTRRMFLHSGDAWEEKGVGGAAAWGTLSGTLSDQTDLQTILNGKADSHSHPYEPANVNIQSHVGSSHAPVNAEQNVNADWNAGSGDAQILNKPATYAPSSHNNTAHSETYLTGITKPMVEAVLTGEIATHSHAGGGSPSGVIDDMQMSILQSDGTLNAALGVQTWAGTNKTGQDVFTLIANKTYRVRGMWIVNTGATTHTTAMAWALSGATVVDFQYQTLLWSAAANVIATAQSTCHVSGVASKVLNATSTAVYTNISFDGILVTGNGGTITPQINFSANPTGTNLMKLGSWTSFTLLGADTVTAIGNWA